MTFAELSQLLSENESPVVLLEGTRELPAGQAASLTSLASHLARTFPQARFRTGNAKGSDEAFAEGVAKVDATRLEFVVPYATHRRKERHPGSRTVVMDDVPQDRFQRIVDATREASPQYKRIAVNYIKEGTKGREQALSQYVLRDTLKVVGCDGVPPPVAGIFFVHAADPDRGGTGHTIRVCRAEGVPTLTQSHWLGWSF